MLNVPKITGTAQLCAAALGYSGEGPKRLLFGSRNQDVGLELGYSTVTDLARFRG